MKVDLPKHYIEIDGSVVQRRLRTLKHGDASAVVDEYGDIGVVGTGPEGLYFHQDGIISLPRDTIAIERTKFLRQAVCYERIGFRNHAEPSSSAGEMRVSLSMLAKDTAAGQLLG